MDEAEGEAAGQWDGGSVSFDGEKYHQPAAGAGAAGGVAGLGAAGGALGAVLQGRGASGIADPGGGGAAFAEAHRGAVGRSGVRAMGAGSVHAIFLRGRIFSARVSAGAFGDDAFSQSRGGAGAGDAVAGDACGGVSGGGVERARHRSGGGGHDGTGKSNRASDRTRTDAGGDRTRGPASEESRAALAAVLRARGAARGHENGTLPAREAEETRAASVEISARAAAAADPRRAAQDGTGSHSIGADGETAGERVGPRLAHRAPTAR